MRTWSTSRLGVILAGRRGGAAGTALGPTIPLLSSLASVRANARPLGRQGLGQRCRRHDPNGSLPQATIPPLQSAREVRPRRAIAADESFGATPSRGKAPTEFWTRIGVLQTNGHGRRSDVSPRDVTERKGCLPPKEPRPPCIPVGEQVTF
jgi:hypothetical protein